MINEEYKPGGAMLAGMTVFMVIYLVILVARIGSSVSELALLDRISKVVHRDVDGLQREKLQREADANDRREMLIAMIGIAVHLVVAVLFLRLLSRANRNVFAMGVRGVGVHTGVVYRLVFRSGRQSLASVSGC